MKRLILLTIKTLLILGMYPCHAQSSYQDLSAQERKYYDEHIYMGQPDDSKVFVKNAFVFRYNHEQRIPVWSAYHVVPDYLNTPSRKKKYKKFRKDPEIPNAVVTSDYTGSGYARGHYVPYFVLGGDRDKDGIYSDLYDDSKDPQDDQTVFEGNMMTNIAPQDHNALNGAGGPWYALETKIRTKMIPKLKELHLIVGGIVSDPDNYEQVMHRQSKPTGIAIPDKFYQVIIYQDPISKEHMTAAFLFPHVRERYELPYQETLDYMVPVDSVELLTGLNFFHELDDTEEDAIESETNRGFWEGFFE
ncbi:DNA/RNA non-specific endonuclease [Reichenbachiella versicolor]|uniref:DNA/RNA non-specific endonuclease n=1 Tax=Reichenbachiella versicolor TaxID=1821036 RepID=UPI000D6DC778|nr:DNA/RNA non-specific endonuclease [Reichenbachiella versicolor]